MIPIYIPTMGRVEKQKTWERMPPKVQKWTKLVVPPDEVEAHKAKGRQAVGCPVKGIAATRDWIIDYAHRACQRRIVMLDDDLQMQKQMSSGKIVNIESGEYETAMLWLKEKLAHVAHASLAIRFAGWNDKRAEMSPGRCMHVLAYDVQVVKAVKARFSQTPEGKPLPVWYSIDDFHMALQLLKAGHTNVVSLLWRTSPGVANSKGGASLWRTAKTQSDSAELLAKMHPEHVRVKQQKGWLGMEGTMSNVTVLWKKALKG